MKLRELLKETHISQKISIQGDGVPLTTGYSSQIKDESYLDNEVNYFYSDGIDHVVIEIL